MTRSINELPSDLYDAFKVIQEAKLNPRVVNDSSTRFASICPFHNGKGFAMWGDLDGIQGCSCKACGELDPDTAIATARMIGATPPLPDVPESIADNPADNATVTAPEAIADTLTPDVPESLPDEKEPEIAAPTATAPVRKERPATTTTTTLDKQTVGIRYDDFINALDQHGFKPKVRGQGHTSLCPAHDDNNPSLDIDRKKDGGVLTICRSAGCSFDEVIDALGLKGVGYEKPVKTLYPTRKGIRVHAPAYLDGDDLIIPLVDIHGNKKGTQTIFPEKRTIQGKETDKMVKGKGQNEYCFQFGDRTVSETLYIATGYATSASIYESTGNPVTMSISDTTLPHTIELIRKTYANKELIVCCDYDARNDKRIIEAVNRCNALLCYPTIEGNLKADFNDLMLHSGKESVCEIVGNAHKPEPVDSGNKSESESKAQSSQATETVILRSAASIMPRRIDWLWEGWLAVGKLHLLAGAPGTAKTTIALTLGAAVSRGGQFPDGSLAKRGKVLIWSSEDDPRDTLIPRLIAAGADLNNVHIVESVNHNKGKRIFDPAKDFPLLKSAVEQIGNVSFMVIDSVADAVTGDSGKNNQVRRALSPIKEFSEEMGIATLGITHFNKNTTGKAMSRIIDSVAFVGLPRVVMIAFKKRGNGSLMMRAKSNIGPDNGGYEFYTYVEPLIGYDGISANRVGFKGFVEGSADDHLRDAESNIDEPEDEQQKAEKFLMDEFSDGMRRESSAVTDKAKSLGISIPTLQRARKALGMASKKINNKWYIYSSTTEVCEEEPPF